MAMHPMIAALRKHKSGVIITAMQIAFTLAIVCNAIFIISYRLQRVGRPTGLNESNLFVVTQQWVGAPTGDDPGNLAKLDAMQREDLSALRAMPDVDSVTPSNSLPLFDSSWNGSVSSKPDAPTNEPGPSTTFYVGDENYVKTLGLKIVAGRSFTASDIVNKSLRDTMDPSMVMVTKALADKLYPQGNAVGKSLYLNGGAKPSTIIGVVARLQIPGNRSASDSFEWNATVEPFRVNTFASRYVVRTKPGRMEATMKAAPGVLYKVNPMRVLDKDSIKAFSAVRAKAYRADIGMALLMSVVSVLLVTITSAGIVGLSSFWVEQRYRQIGIRRALGARKTDIRTYFQLENLLIAGGGAVVGIILAVGLNLLLIQHFEMDRLPAWYVFMGSNLVILIGQVAVFLPATRASNVPPVVATRSA